MEVPDTTAPESLPAVGGREWVGRLVLTGDVESPRKCRHQETAFNENAGLVHHLHGPSLKLKLVGGGRADSYLSLDFRYFFVYRIPP